MRKILTILVFALLAFTVQAQLAGKKIYIDPGHGTYTANDRPAATIPYPKLSNGMPQTGVGFYESNTNLWKCEELQKKLIAAGASVKMSRTKNGVNPSLSARRTEATNWGANFFISVHSNAATEGTTTNFLYLALSGHSGVSSSLQTLQRATATTAWPYVFEIMGEGSHGYVFEPHTHYSYTNMKIAPQSLGVMRHSIRGYLTEGYFHTYQPSRHRALNKDWCRQEGVRYYRGIAAYYGHPAETKGYIMGVVKRSDKKMVKSATLKAGQFYYKDGSHDQFYPCNGATVYLYNSAKTQILKTYTVDNNWNGVFLFEDLTPGTYYLGAKASGCGNVADTYRKVVVTANKTSYPIVLMTAGTFDESKEPVNGTGGGGTTDPEPNDAVKGIYAYDLKLSTDAESYTFTFTANTKPTAAAVVFYKDGIENGRKTITSPVAGSNKLTVKNTELPGNPGDVLNWGVELKGEAVSAWTQLYQETDVIYKRAFNTVDNSPESDYFGRIYVADRTGASTSNNGIYAYNQAWKLYSTTPYKGGQSVWGNPTRPAVAPDGSVFFADWADAHSGVFVAAPGKVSGDYTTFFAGTMESNGAYNNGGIYTGSGTPGVHIYGTSENTKLIVYNEDAKGTLPANGLAIYNIGNADGSITTTWETAPNQVITLAEQGNTEGNVWGTSHGIFISQVNDKSTTNDVNKAGRASLMFYDWNGIKQFSSTEDSFTRKSDGATKTFLSNLTGTKGGGFAVSADEKLLMINDGSNNFMVFSISWSGNKPVFTLLEEYNHGVTDVRQMNFDYAGNLIASGKGGFYIFATPHTSKSTNTTPAKKALTVTVGGGASTPDTPVEEPITFPNEGDLVAGTITFESLWTKTTTNAEYLNSGSNDNRSIACYNGLLYLPNKADGTFTVINAADGSKKETKTIGTSSFLHHNLRITRDGKMLLGNTGSGTVTTAAVTVLGSDIAIGGQTTLGSSTMGGRSDYFYTYGDWNKSGYIIALTNENDTTKAEMADLDMAFLKIPFANGALNVAEGKHIRNATLPISYASAKAIPMNDKMFFASAIGVAPTLHKLSTGDIVDDWGTEKPEQDVDRPTSGTGVFTIHGHTYLIAPLNRFGKFEIYEVSYGLSKATKVTEVGTVEEIGRTNANGLATVDFATAVSGNDVFIYVFAPNNGISAHKFTFTPDKAEEPDVTYGSVNFYLQGGTLNVPADNEALWDVMGPEFDAYYPNAYKKYSDGAHKNITNLTNFFYVNYTKENYAEDKVITDTKIWTATDSPWKWLGDYMQACTNNGISTVVHWRFTTDGFFRQRGTTANQIGDWTEAGKPAAWQPAYIFGHKPTKNGATFLGWFDNAQGTGSPLAALPKSGNVYACWKSVSTAIETTENTSTVYLAPTFTGVEIFFEGTQPIAIYNVNGMRVAGGISTDYYACDLPSGMYIIRIGMETYKFIK